MSADAPADHELSREADAAVDELVEETEEHPQYFFEMYQMAVEMADRVTARRNTANAFYATINTGLLALIGSQEFGWYAPIAGLALSWTWLALLTSYRDLNSAKFKIIDRVETRLPIRVFGDEWDDIKKRKKDAETRRRGLRKHEAKYREQGEVERRVPLVFAALYVCAILTEVNWPW